MPWLKLLHLATVIVWCGTLLYLPWLIQEVAGQPSNEANPLRRQWPRKLFIHMVTPAALLSIASGTLIFVTSGLTPPWLMLKLVVVGLLVLGHGACGLLVLRAERPAPRDLRRLCVGLRASLPVLLLLILWLVLRKPT